MQKLIDWFNKHSLQLIILGGVAALGGLAFLLRGVVGPRGVAVFGVACFLGLCFAISRDPRRVNLRAVATGMSIQVLLALFVLETELGRQIFGMLGGANFHLRESVAFLRDTPLDLRQWTVDNSARADVKQVRHPMLDPLQLDRMLPPSERGVMRWDKNPWTTVAGDFSDAEGRLESSGVFWLLPYWMGRYAGFIEAPPSDR